MMRNLRGGAWGLLVLFFFLKSSFLSSQTINPYFFFTSPPTPVGSGARAMGVGGAFIAVADDATAAMWNPSALIQLELPEASLVLDSYYRTIDTEVSELQGINYASASYPFTVNEVNMILSLNYQRLYDFYLDFENKVKFSVDDTSNQATWLIKGNGNPGAVNQYDIITLTTNNQQLDSKITTENTGELDTLSPAFAIQVTPKFSLGITVNFWRDGWLDPGRRYKSKHKEETEGVFRQVSYLWYDSDGDCTCNGGKPCSSNDYVDDLSCVDELIPESKLPYANPLYSKAKFYQTEIIVKQKLRMEGESYNLGLLWDITPRWTLGAVYRTGAKLRVDRELKSYFKQVSAWKKLNYGESQGESNYDESLYLPSAYGLGVGFRYSDALTFTGDLTMVRWDDYYYEPEEGKKYSLVTGLNKGVDDVEPTLTFRAGAEYLFIKPKYVVPIRGGFFYDQEPSLPHPDSFYGITLGSGFVYKWLVLDLTYFYRFGPGVHVGHSVNAERTELIEDEKGDVFQHQLMLSGIFHFE